MTFPIDYELLAHARTKLAGRPLLWIVGGAGAGKTTLCHALSAQHGLPVYDMDAHIYGSYHGRFDPVRHPANTAWSTAPDGLAWLLGMPWEEFDAFNRAALPEYLDLFVEDLDALAPSTTLLVDGGICTPALLCQAVPVDKIICLPAPAKSSAAVWEQDPERLAMKDALAHLPDPEAAWRTFLDFDARITQTISEECLNCGIAELRDCEIAGLLAGGSTK
jgi:hypothetical protein